MPGRLTLTAAADRGRMAPPSGAERGVA